MEPSRRQWTLQSLHFFPECLPHGLVGRQQWWVKCSCVSWRGWRGDGVGPACPGQCRSTNPRPHAPDPTTWVWFSYFCNWVILSPHLPARLWTDVGGRKRNLWSQAFPERSGQKSKLTEVRIRTHGPGGGLGAWPQDQPGHFREGGNTQNPLKTPPPTTTSHIHTLVSKAFPLLLSAPTHFHH